MLKQYCTTTSGSYHLISSCSNPPLAGQISCPSEWSGPTIITNTVIVSGIVFAHESSICFYYPSDNTPNEGICISINLKQKYNFKMRQTTGVVDKNNKQVSIYQDESRIHYDTFTLDKEYREFIKCYLSDPENQPTKAILSNFRFTQNLIYPGKTFHLFVQVLNPDLIKLSHLTFF